MEFDISVFEAFHGLSGKFSTLDFFAVFLAQYLPYILIIAFFAALFFEPDWRKRFHNFALASLSVILARGIFVEFIRFFYYRPRPELVLSIEPLIRTPGISSFPSGHTATFFALAVAMFFFNRRLGWWFTISAVLVALARVLTGVHWPSDILAGMIVGIVSAFIIRKLLNRKTLKPKNLSVNSFKEV